MFGDVYVFGNILVLNSTHLVFEAPNLIITFVSMLVILFQSLVEWQHGCMRCVNSVCVRMSLIFTCLVTCMFSVTFWFSILHTSSPNLISTFVSMLVILFQSLVEWQHG